MREQGGDIWDHFGKAFVVIPTNIGWKKPDKNGRPGPNVMGAGVALEASKRVPNLASLYGEYCARFGADTEVTVDLTTGLVLFPTKPLNESSPGMSWKSSASLELIERSALQLASMSWMTRTTLSENHDPGHAPTLIDDTVYLPTVGCGNGGLDQEPVTALLHRILADDRFVLVHFEPY